MNFVTAHFETKIAKLWFFLVFNNIPDQPNRRPFGEKIRHFDFTNVWNDYGPN